MEKPPSIPPAIAAVNIPPAAEADVSAGSSELSERHKLYAARFHQWLLNLNRHDFLQAKRVLDGMMHAYAKHTMKIHSPPAKKDNDVSGKTSDGAAPLDLPPGDGPAAA